MTSRLVSNYIRYMKKNELQNAALNVSSHIKIQIYTITLLNKKHVQKCMLPCAAATQCCVVGHIVCCNALRSLMPPPTHSPQSPPTAPMPTPVRAACRTDTAASHWSPHVRRTPRALQQQHARKGARRRKQLGTLVHACIRGNRDGRCVHAYVQTCTHMGDTPRGVEGEVHMGWDAATK